MPNTCKDCIHFYKQDNVLVEGPNITQNTYIESKNPEIDPTDPTNLLLTIAQCSNSQTTNEIITRDASTNWFFDVQKPYWAIVANQIVVAGENDICANFEAIP